MMDFDEYSSNCTTFSNLIHITRYIYLLFSNTIVDLCIDLLYTKFKVLQENFFTPPNADTQMQKIGQFQDSALVTFEQEMISPYRAMLAATLCPL